MKIALIVVMCVLLVFVLLAYPISVKLKFHVDAVNMVCFYSLKVWFIKLLCGKSSIENSTLVIQNTHDLIWAPIKSSPSGKAFAMALLPKIDIARTEMYFVGGVSTDACATALMCGSVQVVTSIIASFLISISPYINIYQDIDPVFNQDKLEFTFNGILQISILDIILAKLQTLFFKEEI